MPAAGGHEAGQLLGRPVNGHARPAAAIPAAPPAVYAAPAASAPPAVAAAPAPPGTGGKLAEVSRSTMLNLIGAGVSVASTLGITVLITRLFSRPVAGAFFTATSLFMIVESVASLGAFTGLVYFITRLRMLNSESRISSILRAATIPVLAVSMTFTIALLLFASPVARVLLGGHLGHSGATVPAVTAALRALAITLPFAALLDTLLGASRGYRDMRPTVMINQVARSGIQLAGVAVAALAGTAALLAPLWAVPYIPATAAAWIWLRRIRRRPGTPRRADSVPSGLAALMALATPVRSDGTKLRPGESADERLANATPRGFWRFTTPRAIAVLAQITVQRIDIVLVAIIISPTAAAVYTAATRFLVAGQLGNGAISMAAQPQFTELFAMGATRRANIVYQVTTAWLVLLTWPMYLLVIVFGTQILAIFGHSYQAGYTVLIILAVASLISAVCGQVDMVLITTGRTSWSLANGLSVMVVNVGLDLLLIPRYGITGAAIAWAVAIGVFNVLPLTQLAMTVRLHPFGRASFLAAALCAACFYVIPEACRLLLGDGMLSIAASIAAGCAALAVGLWRFREGLRLSLMPGMSSVLGLAARLRAAR